MYLEATEELSLDSPQTTVDVNHEKDDVLSDPLVEPVDNNHSGASSSNDPPKLKVSESAVSPPVPKSQSVPEVTPTSKQRLGAKVDKTCCCYCFPVFHISPAETYLVCLHSSVVCMYTDSPRFCCGI